MIYEITFLQLATVAFIFNQKYEMEMGLYFLRKWVFKGLYFA